MNPPQIDDYLPKKFLRWIGGLRTYGARLNFYLGLLNTATLMLLLYKNSPLIRYIFPSVYVWLAAVAFVFVPFVVAIDYTIFHPSELTYNSHQVGRENRSPNFRETMNNQRLIKELQEDIEEIKDERGGR